MEDIYINIVRDIVAGGACLSFEPSERAAKPPGLTPSPRRYISSRQRARSALFRHGRSPAFGGGKRSTLRKARK
jgi:hypothetical protein